MYSKVQNIPLETAEHSSDRMADLIWSKKTEIVAFILIMIMALPILGVMITWTLHQLAVMQ